MNILTQRTCEYLGKEKPARTLRPLLAVESACVNMWFNSFYGDVWTADGWLITASYENDTWAVRKGNQAARVKIAADEILYSTIVPHNWEEKRAAYEQQVFA
jgi:hypothetical protein